MLKNVDVSKNLLEKFPRGASGPPLATLCTFLTKHCVEIGWLDASIRKLNFSYNQLTVLPGEICFLTLSLELDLNFNPQLKARLFGFCPAAARLTLVHCLVSFPRVVSEGHSFPHR